MENNTELITNAFPARFGQFLDAHDKLNPNSLAGKMSSDPDEVKTLAVKYGRWLNGKAKPSFESLIEISQKFNIDMNWWTMGVGTMKREQMRPSTDAPKANSTIRVHAPGVRDENDPLVVENQLLKDQLKRMEDMLEFVKMYTMNNRPPQAIPVDRTLTGKEKQSAEGSFNTLNNLPRKRHYSRFESDALTVAYLTQPVNVKPVYS